MKKFIIAIILTFASLTTSAAYYNGVNVGDAVLTDGDGKDAIVISKTRCTLQGKELDAPSVFRFFSNGGYIIGCAAEENGVFFAVFELPDGKFMKYALDPRNFRAVVPEDFEVQSAVKYF